MTMSRPGSMGSSDQDQGFHKVIWPRRALRVEREPTHT